MTPPLARRIVNIVNFIRFDEPREPELDLLEPIAEQLRLLRAAGLPGTWLLQFDALVAGPYVRFLQENLPADHEVGLWFELNRKHCDAAGVPFNGAAHLNWDFHAQAWLSVGYTPAQRERLVDVAVARFAETFHRPLLSVAAWYIDAHTLGYLADRHGVVASANCKEQYGTDGYTLWGGPYAGGYYPNRRNALSAAVSPASQVPLPVFRMLGADPIHQYDLNLGAASQDVVSLEPVYGNSGANEAWMRRYLDILALAPALALTQAQAGQENSFGWARMAEGFTRQVRELAQRRAAGELEIECLGQTGQWFRRTFPTTPAQTTVALRDTLGGRRRALWFHSHAYRAGLLFDGDAITLRDLHVFPANYAEEFLQVACTTHQAVFDTPPILDGFAWSTPAERARGEWQSLRADGSAAPLALTGEPSVQTQNSELTVSLPVGAGRKLRLHFRADQIHAELEGAGTGERLILSVRWPAGTSTSFVSAAATKANFRHRGFDYAVTTTGGRISAQAAGFTIASEHSPAFTLALID